MVTITNQWWVKISLIKVINFLCQILIVLPVYNG